MNREPTINSIERAIEEECQKKIQFYSKKITTLKKISTQSFPKLKQTHTHTLQGIQNGRFVQLLYDRYRKISQIYAKVIFLTVTLHLIYFQQQTNLIVSQINDRTALISTQTKLLAESRSQHILWFGFILSVFSCIFAVMRYQAQKLVYLTQKINFLNRFFLILETLVLMMIPYPGVDSTYMQMSLIENNQLSILLKVNHFMCVFALLKILFLFRQILQDNYGQIAQINTKKFFRPSYNRICKIYSCQKDYTHIMKCLFKEHFILFIVLVYSLLLLVGAYILRIAQINYDGRFYYFQNSFWVTLMSMTTIGYGDIAPSTSFGVIIDGFSAYAGVIIVSLLVASLTDLFTMGYRQRRSLLILKRLNMKKQLKQSATKYIQSCLYRLYKQKKLQKSIKQSLLQKQHQIEFHNKRMDLKNNKEGSVNLVKQMYDQFQAVKLRLDELVILQNDLMMKLSDKQRFGIQTARSTKIFRRNSLEVQDTAKHLPLNIINMLN